jgi:hypothetical protein
MPDPVPVMVLGRLEAILVHKISEDAKRLYERCGFRSSPVDPMTPMITSRDAEKLLAEGNKGSAYNQRALIGTQ